MLVSNFSYVFGLRPFRTFDNIKFNSIAFLQRFEALTGDGGKMTKNIFPVLLFKKTKPLCVVEPFNFSFSHFLFSPYLFNFTRMSPGTN